LRCVKLQLVPVLVIAAALLILPSLVGATSMWSSIGANALGQVFSDVSDLWGTGNLVDQQQRRRDAREWDRQTAVTYGNQLRYDREGIVARVEGAKAAGVHPLAALGMSATGSVASVPMQVGGAPRTPPVQADPHFDREVRAAQLRLLKAQADDAENVALASRLALASQAGQPPVAPLTQESKGVTFQASPGLELGERPASQFFRFPEGVAELPTEDLKQAIEDLPIAAQLYYLYRNSLPKVYTDESRRLKHRIKDQDYTHLVRRNKKYPRRIGAAGPQYHSEKYRHY
jgi:hypothetical protein